MHINSQTAMELLGKHQTEKTTRLVLVLTRVSRQAHVEAREAFHLRNR